MFYTFEFIHRFKLLNLKLSKNGLEGPDPFVKRGSGVRHVWRYMRGGSERLEEGKESPDEVGVVYCDGCGRIWTRWLTGYELEVSGIEVVVNRVVAVVVQGVAVAGCKKKRHGGARSCVSCSEEAAVAMMNELRQWRCKELGQRP
ncbi:hypothetical protein F2Q68_00040452 [Brassica cretica]|uniref:Uncharacterized protein n=1 Tax=Brassica cretica TaxID=69181 RepID=A0A8S9MQI9_BRACR|nr:hypothetical protein F2Q68_00040452 [Brassica cretica]